MTKSDMLKILLDDFKKMFPEAKHRECLALFMRINMLEEKDLRLLIEQLEKEAKNENL